MSSQNRRHVRGNVQEHSDIRQPGPSNSLPADESHSHQNRQALPVCTWSAHSPQCGTSPSPLPRSHLALTRTATAASELFLFGGQKGGSARNDLYVISTQDFSTTLVESIGKVPSPRFYHRVVLASTFLLIWGGKDGRGIIRRDESFYLLDIGASCASMSTSTQIDQSFLCISIAKVVPSCRQRP
jgi:Galactose oxidase, central domain